MQATAYLLLTLDTTKLDVRGFPAVIGVSVCGELHPTIMLGTRMTAELTRATADTYGEAKANVLRQVQHHAWLKPLLKE